MKKSSSSKGLLLLLLLFSGLSVTAQNWLTTGNSGTNGSNFIGITDNHSFRIGINGTPYVVFDSTYKTIITSPYTTLSDSDILRIYSTDAGKPTLHSSINSDGNQYWFLSTTGSAYVGAVAVTTPAGYPGISFWNGTTGPGMANRFDMYNAGNIFNLKYAAAATGLAIDSLGRIGIGTTTLPSNLLNINVATAMQGITLQGINPAITLDSGGAIAAYIGVATNANGFSSNAKAGDFVVRTSSADNAVRNSIIMNTAGGNIMFTTKSTISPTGTGDSVRLNINRFGTVGIGQLADTSYHSDAALVINGTTQGVLLPRLTTTQVNAIGSPEKGLIVYDSTVKTFKYYNGTAWSSLAGTAGYWSLTGNAGISGSNFLGTTNNTSLAIQTNATTRMIIDSVGNVTVKNKLFIGTVDSTKTANYLLAVNGAAIFTKVKAKLYAEWPDYVFEDNYNLPALKDVAAYIKENKHLPGIPAAAEMQAQGIDLGDNQTVLLKKMEELTLYIIEQNKRSEEQDKIISEQDNKIKALEEQNQQIVKLQEEINELESLVNKK